MKTIVILYSIGHFWSVSARQDKKKGVRGFFLAII